MRACFICEKRDTVYRELSFHMFPKERMKRMKWLEILNLKTVPNRAFLCSNHFRPGDIYSMAGGRKKLNQNANPVPCTIENGTDMPNTILQMPNYLNFQSVPESLDSYLKETCVLSGNDFMNSEGNEHRDPIADLSGLGYKNEFAQPPLIYGSVFNVKNEVLIEPKEEMDESDTDIRSPSPCTSETLTASETDRTHSWIDDVKREESDMGTIVFPDELDRTLSESENYTANELVQCLSPTVSDTENTVSTCTKKKRRRKAVLGDMTDDDFFNPDKAKLAFKLANNRLNLYRTKLRTLQQRFRRLASRMLTLTSYQKTKNRTRKNDSLLNDLDDANETVICRICVEKVATAEQMPDVEIVFDKGKLLAIKDVIKAISGLEIKDSEMRHICLKCVEDAVKSLKFKVLCEESTKKFEEYRRNEIRNNFIELEEISIKTEEPDYLEETSSCQNEQPNYTTVYYPSDIGSIRTNENKRRNSLIGAERDDKLIKIRKKVDDRDENGYKVVTCEFCSKMFLVDDILLEHEKIYGSKKKFLCYPCGGVFENKVDLSAVIGLHKKEEECHNRGSQMCDLPADDLNLYSSCPNGIEENAHSEAYIASEHSPTNYIFVGKLIAPAKVHSNEKSSTRPS